MVNKGLDVWDVITQRQAHAEPGVYIAVSGNTAAGKSSLISEIERRLSLKGVAALGISERIFHHRYLQLMFAEPGRFAFPIQLAFMLERHIVLLRNLVDLRRTVVMERSHFDDALFVEEHVRSGAITLAQHAAYEQLASVLHSALPAPHLLVLMNPSVETSLERLQLAEARGDRPREFPSEIAKEGWVRRWHSLYAELHARYRERVRTDPAWATTHIVELDPAQPREMSADKLEAAIGDYGAPAG